MVNRRIFLNELIFASFVKHSSQWTACYCYIYSIVAFASLKMYVPISASLVNISRYTNPVLSSYTFLPFMYNWQFFAPFPCQTTTSLQFISVNNLNIPTLKKHTHMKTPNTFFHEYIIDPSNSPLMLKHLLNIPFILPHALLPLCNTVNHIRNNLQFCNFKSFHVLAIPKPAMYIQPTFSFIYLPMAWRRRNVWFT